MPGDAVTLASGGTGTVWWIGTRDFVPALLPASERARLVPVRLRQGALAEGRPARDMLVSPTLRLGPTSGNNAADRVRYIHLELAVPGALIVEGVPVDSYHDTGDRNLFSNVATYVPVLRALADDDPDIHVLADGKRFEAASVSVEEIAFEIPSGTGVVVIRSRSIVPALASLTSADQRRLGICLLGITIRSPGMNVEIGIDDASLSDGFYAAESGARWTDGEGVLPSQFLRSAGFTLVLRHVRTALPYGKGLLPRRPPTGITVPGARRLSSSARVLVIDASVPTPDRDAGSNVILWHMRLLRRLGLAVTFLPLNLTAFPGYTDDLRRDGIATVETPAYASVEAFLRDNGTVFDLVYVHRFAVAEACLPALRRYAPQAPILFNPADLHHLRLQREAEIAHSGQREALEVRARELAVIAASDLTLVCSTVERNLILEALPDAHIRMLPWVIEAPPATPPPFSARSGIMFLGGFNHRPNVDAVRWFASDVLGLLRGLVPDATLHVYGADMPSGFAALEGPGLIVEGHVADLGPVFDRHRIMVAPLRYGAGFKGKLAEALARGLPIVATSIAAEGSGLVPGEHLLTADTASGIAAALARLQQDEAEWTRLSSAGAAFARERLSPERGLAHLRGALRDLGLSARAR